MNHLVSFVASFGLALFLTWYVRDLAVRNKWVWAAPSDRHLHVAPMPRIGGVAIVLTFFCVTGGLACIARLTGTQFGFPTRSWLGLLEPGLLISPLGYMTISGTPALILNLEPRLRLPFGCLRTVTRLRQSHFSLAHEHWVSISAWQRPSSGSY